MNPNPEVFGPHFWFTMHSIAFFYPEYPNTNTMRIHKEFFESFIHLLPCEKCKNHYKMLLTKYPIDGHLDSREQLSRWVVFIHNQVNKKLGKPEKDFESVVQYYKNAYSQSPSQITKKTKGLLFGIILCISGFFLYERNYMKNKLF